MRALRFYGQRDIRLEEIPGPQVRPGTVKIKVDWCGICGTDLHEYLGGPIFIPKRGSPHPLTGETLPLVLGHEFAGQVVAIGEGVTRVKVGDAVTVEPVLHCGECPECRSGAYNICRQIGFHGLSGGGGGFAEFTVVPEYMAHKLPAGMSTELGALVEPVAVGFHAVRRSKIAPGESAIVFGAGPIGLIVLQCLRAAGASQVAVVEVAAARKEMARKLGASLVIDPREEDVVAAARAATGDVGYDAAFDCAGLPITFQQALGAVRRRGTLVNVAIWEEPTQIHLNDLVFSEVNLTGVLCYNNEYAATIAMMADGRIPAGELITKRIKLADIVEEGFGELVRNKDRNVKILVQP